MEKFSKLDVALSKTEEFLLGILLTTASIVLFANVVARYVFNWGFPWAEELVRYEIIWMVFLGGSIAARQGLHIGVDLLVRFAPVPLKKWRHHRNINEQTTTTVQRLALFCSYRSSEIKDSSVRTRQ